MAYNFQKRFAPLVEDGAKRQTIRAHRKGRARHAQPGEPIQLYTGMRSKACRKLIDPDPTCKSVEPILIGYDLVLLSGRPLSAAELNQLALADGLGNAQSFIYFFRETHGLPFRGVLIKWE